MFSADVERALLVALEAHRDQVRKGGSQPYAVHPLHVALMLARLGASDSVIQAGLLHDVVEDSSEWTLSRVERDFGPEVGSIVAQLTEDKSRGWAERKAHGIARVATLTTEAACVKACDKLHNLRTLAQALREARAPEAVWMHFKGGRERTLEMSESLVRALRSRLPAELGQALVEALEEVKRAALAPPPRSWDSP